MKFVECLTTETCYQAHAEMSVQGRRFCPVCGTDLPTISGRESQLPQQPAPGAPEASP